MKLIEAVSQNNIEEVKRLLSQSPKKREFNINDVDEESKATALWWAARWGYDHFIPPLIMAGAVVNKADEDGRTPVFIAAQFGHAQAIAALHTARADMNMGDKYRRTPVIVAAAHCNVEAIIALHAAGANINTTDRHNKAPILIAILNRSFFVVRCLLECDANRDFNALLDVARGVGNKCIVELLEIYAWWGFSHSQPLPSMHFAFEQSRKRNPSEIDTVRVGVEIPNNYGYHPFF